MLGLCGGYQMLGQTLADPLGIEGPPRSVPGLGLLDVTTTFGGDKTLRNVSGQLTRSNANFSGYEIHIGTTSGPDTARPLVRFDDGRTDGAISASGQVSGCYVHGLFADDRPPRPKSAHPQMGANVAGVAGGVLTRKGKVPPTGSGDTTRTSSTGTGCFPGLCRAVR